MKQKKHGTITSQNINITGNYNYTVGISMNQTGGDDCEQSQTVVIKNPKSEKKKEKKESVFGSLASCSNQLSENYRTIYSIFA